MKRLLAVLGILVVVVSIAGGSVVAWASMKTGQALEQVYGLTPVSLAGTTPSVEIGRRIVMIRNGCNDCHGDDLGGKLIVDDPAFGTIYGSNLTPAALADWSDEELAMAIRHGVNRERRPLVFMPSQDYILLSKEDLASVVAYLRSVPPVEKENVPVKLGPIGKLLFATGKAPTIIAATAIDHGAQFTAKPSEEPTREFGRYLVATSCTGCHGRALTGGPIPGAPPEWLPATDLTKLSEGTKEQFIKAMREGIRPDGSKVQFPMPIALTSQLTDLELDAMWMFLQSPEPI